MMASNPAANLGDYIVVLLDPDQPAVPLKMVKVGSSHQEVVMGCSVVGPRHAPPCPFICLTPTLFVSYPAGDWEDVGCK